MQAAEQAAEVTRTRKIWLGADGILRIVAFPDMEETLDDARQTVAVGTKLAAGKPRPMLVDLRGLKQPASREVRAYYVGPEAQNMVLAGAILVDSPIGRLIGNLFLGFNKASLPTKLFKSEDEALAWLRGFLE